MKKFILKFIYLSLLSFSFFIFINFFYLIQSTEEMILSIVILYIIVYILDRFGLWNFISKKIGFLSSKIKFRKNKATSSSLKKSEKISVKTKKLIFAKSTKKNKKFEPKKLKRMGVIVVEKKKKKVSVKK